MPRVSIVVSLFNKGPYISRALRSISAQTFADFEVIVVDDGSTDGGAEQVETHADPRFRLIRQENAGPGAARNRGLAQVTGDLVAFLDADDEWMPDYLNAAVAALSDSRAATVTCSYVDSPGEHSASPLWLRRGLSDGFHRITPATAAAMLVSMVAFMTPCSTVSRTEVLRRWGGFYSSGGCRYAEDAILWLKVLLNETVLFDLTPRVRIHRDASQLSKVGNAHPLEPFLDAPEEVQSVCPQNLRPLLRSFYATRAFKTACVWSYWGKWREGAKLRQAFDFPGASKVPYYWLSRACATSIGALAGATIRLVRS